MLELIKKWWNRKWSDWEYYKTITTYIDSSLVYKNTYEIYMCKSSDGLKKYKKVYIHRNHS